MRFTFRSAAGVAGAGVCCVLLASCGGGGSQAADANGAAENSEEYVAALSPHLARLGNSANQTGKALLTAARPADLVKLNRSARSQIALVSEIQGHIGGVTPPKENARAHRLLQSAMTSHRLYLGHLARLSAANPANATKALPAATRAGKRALDVYRAFYRAAPNELPRTITDAGLVELSGVRVALRASAEKQAAAKAKADQQAEARARAAAAAAAAAATPPPAPAPSHGPVTGAGVDYDIVDNSGGEGVRYRYSPRLSDLVPGNGPREGAQVTINCFTSGEFVRATDYWAVLTNGYYVPATYLRHSYSGPVAGATYC